MALVYLGVAVALGFAFVCVVRLFTAGADRGIPEGRSDGAELELAAREAAAVADHEGPTSAWFDPHLFV